MPITIQISQNIKYYLSIEFHFLYYVIDSIMPKDRD